ncbi:unnamed protein product [Brachionus calyciflorus]|uniref:Uncharacterized protein n=1 Tax=Brachionus calyciflorus TaxID=104777 RepID=A0A813TFT2_9BILA|nr:unnamed protein product [Brachionus calyciflorus]
MNSNLPFSSSKLLFTIVVLCAFNIYLSNCEFLNTKFRNNPKPIGKIYGLTSSERQDDYLTDLYDSSESESNELSNTDYVTKLKLLELFLNEMNRRKDDAYDSINKRSKIRSLGKDDRRRPGWELAYGRRKRNVSN